MRRLVLLIAALALLGAPNASAAKPPSGLVVAGGAAHAVDGKLRGWFVVANHGTTRSRAIRAAVLVRMGELPSRVLVQWRPVRATVPSLAPAETHRVRFSVPIPGKFGAQRSPIRVCVTQLPCLRIGHLTVTSSWERQHPAKSASGTVPSPTNGTPSPLSPVQISTVPTDPIPHPVAEPFFHAGGGAEYWGFIPRSYDATNQTPTTLFVWLHGCGGDSEGDAWVVDPGAEEGVPQDWMTLSLGGRDGGCWNPLAETEPLVMAALADFETHFNVDRRRVILGGYSSGGDLAYRTGFFHSSTFAGLLIENSAPFRDTEATQSELLGAATTKFHIVHLAHEEDETYGLAEVQQEVATVKAAGFPIELIERPGKHWSEPGEVVAGHPVPGTDADLRELLLPHIDEGWLAPGP
jgi:predicted esterase